ncbi:MAG TPA: LysR family transcriptional regulator, partial [Ardenticatenaceae bacterium]|nr:LysR family transcriptional regulator [Ardenticatenaceae bacterium]
MELRQLATFRMVAATLSFTQAAAALGYVQSSVTAQIQALEGELGVRLFDRLGKRIALTDAGERLLRYADQMLALAEEARVAVTDGEAPVGTLTLSAPETLCTYRLPVVLRKFRARFPQVRLLFRPSAAGEMQRLAAEGTLDVAFVLAEPVRAQGLRVEALLPEPILVLAPPGHRLAAASEVRAVDLAGESI